MRLSLLLIALLAGSASAAAERKLGSLSFTPCILSNSVAPSTVQAQCTRFEVLEHRAQPKGRSIELAIAWIPASGVAEADPIFLLAGGPGQSAREAWPMIASAFTEVARARHVILIDQRGTGQSNPLSCSAPESEDAQLDGSATQARQLAERCLTELAPRADVQHYTTTDAVADLDAVRSALGAAQINLLGISYGSRVAQQYAKTWPKHTRSVVLDSAITTALVLGAEHAGNLETAMKAQFARCRAKPACLAQLGDPETQLQQVRSALAQGGQPSVRYRDATSGTWREEVPTLGHLGILLRMYAYQSLTAATLPQILQQAAVGDWAPLLAQARTTGRQLSEQLMIGMQLSVLCAEDADELKVNPADSATLIGTGFAEALLAQCAVWPRGQRPADFRAPLTGKVPVLLLAGELDPVTPPRYAEVIAAQLPNSRLLLLPGQGHSVLGIGCTPRLFAQFIETLEVQKLDLACLKQISPTPPFTGLYGWDP